MGLANDDLDALKSDPGVIRIYSQYVQGLKKAGNKYVGCCPLPEHNDKTPSFTIFPDGRASCFGCAAHLNIFQLIQKMDGCDFATAVEKVKSELGQTSSWQKTKTKVEEVFKPVVEQKTYKTISLEQWSKLETALANSEAGKKWLDSERGVSYETAKRLRLGFVQNIGNLAGQDGADIADKGWVAFPCIEGDSIISVKYRSIQRKKPGGFARQPGFATAMFNTEAIDPFESVYLTEGELDACVLEQAGFRAVSVPSAGVKLSPTMKDLLMKASTVILAGDNDSTGLGYMQKLWSELGAGVYLLTWPEGSKDANQTLIENCGRDYSKFKSLVQELTSKAKSQPVPGVFSLQETMKSGGGEKLAERSDRFRFPQPTVDDMLIILPGHVFGFGSTETGMGKTMFIVQATLHNAIKYGKTVINFQAEMSPDEIAGLAACQLLRVDRNEMTKEDMKKAAPLLEGVTYYVGRDPNLTELKEVLDMMESAIRRLSPDIVVLDHFHHFSAGADNETKQQADAMTRIKQIAEKYQVVFINIGQPSKPQRSAASKPLRTTDFRGSGAWGQAANSIMAIHRDYRKADEQSIGGKGNFEDKTLVQVIKGRSLGKGKSACFVTCFGEFGSFEELSSAEEPTE